MKVLNISFFHADIIPGGGQQVALNCHRGMALSGIDSTLVGVHNNLTAALRSDATPLVKLPGKQNEYVCQVNSFNGEFMLSDDPWSAKGLFDFAIQLNPDIIYAHHFLMIGVDVLYAMRQALPKTKFVFVAHEFLSVCSRDGHLKRPNGNLCSSFTPVDCVKCFPHASAKTFSIRQAAFAKFLGSMDLIVTPSRFMHKNLLSVYPKLKQKLRCIPNGSYFQKNLDAVVELGTQPGQIDNSAAIGFFGQMLDDKGILPLINAVAGLSLVNQSVGIDFWGGNFDLNRPEFQKQFLGIAEQVNSRLGRKAIILKGVYKNEEVIRLMRRYKVVVFPSTWPETFSLVFSEAIIAGVNIVVPDIGAFSERGRLYKGQVFFYEHGDATGLQAAISSALSKATPVKRAVREDFSIETMAAAYLALAGKKEGASPCTGKREAATTRGSVKAEKTRPTTTRDPASLKDSTKIVKSVRHAVEKPAPVVPTPETKARPPKKPKVIKLITGPIEGQSLNSLANDGVAKSRLKLKPSPSQIQPTPSEHTLDVALVQNTSETAQVVEQG